MRKVLQRYRLGEPGVQVSECPVDRRGAAVAREDIEQFQKRRQSSGACQSEKLRDDLRGLLSGAAAELQPARRCLEHRGNAFAFRKTEPGVAAEKGASKLNDLRL